MRIRQCQPLGKAHGGMFGDTVRGSTDLIEQAGGRRCVEKIAVTALEHARYQIARGINMGHNIHIPTEFPLGVR